MKIVTSLAHALPAILALVGCRSDETIVKQNFATRFTCPEERVSVAKRKDLDSIELAFRAEPAPTDVSADPERLNLWKKEQARQANHFADKAVMQAKGCGHEVFYICGQLYVAVGTTRYLCVAASYPPTGEASPQR